jgi:GAF domain-containing protein
VIDEEHLEHTLASVAEALAQARSVTDLLHDLVDDANKIFDICGAAIVMADEEHRLRPVTAGIEAIASLEMIEERTRQGPCHEVHRLGEPLRITDLQDHADRWPDLAAAAARTGIVATAGVPLHIEGFEFGVLTLYDTRPHQWTDRQIEVAQLLADTTTAYIVYASAYRQATVIVDQLKHALEARVVIEQAKGVLANERNIRVDEAFQVLRQHARDRNAKLSEVAHAVVSLDLRP